MSVERDAITVQAEPARRQGSQIRPRHQGNPPHGQSIAAGSGPAHPHQTALARPGAGSAGTPPVAGRWRTSRLHLASRPGVQKIEVAGIQSYDAATNTALVRIVGAQSNVLGPLPLTQGIASGLAVPGATCLVVLLDEDNPADAAIVAIW